MFAFHPSSFSSLFLPLSQIGRKFDQLDEDHSGTISLHEFLKVANVIQLDLNANAHYPRCDSCCCYRSDFMKTVMEFVEGDTFETVSR